jgi:hypothetical protein
MPLKVEDIDIESLKESKTRVGQKKFVNSQLPMGCGTGNRWRRIFVPTYVAYVAGSKDPWFMDEDAAVVAMQHIWDKIFVDVDTGSIPHVVQINEAVFSIVCQLYSKVHVY